MKAKIPQGSFDNSTKEPFNTRLKLLLRSRTVRQAAEDWDIKLSTIKNYFSRPDSKPRYDVLTKISSIEGVSIEWLLGNTGSNEYLKITQMNILEERKWKERLVEMLDLLSDENLEVLTKQLTLKGVETILYLLDENNIKLLQLPVDEKDRLWALHEAKKGASEDSSGDALTLPTYKAG